MSTPLAFEARLDGPFEKAAERVIEALRLRASVF
jgi:hypothetical protein